jgi:putative oxidoreductase
MPDLDEMQARSCPPRRTRFADLGLLTVRLTAGGLVAGHGAQKLFGAFGGHGLKGTAGWLESIGMRPGKLWATLAGLSEFGGGMLTALGLGGPIGPITMQGAMLTAARKVHWNKPIWSTEGGAELPLLYSSVGVAIALAGPGRYSLDRLFGVRVPTSLVALTIAGVAVGVMRAERASPPAQSEEETAGEAAADGAEAGEDRLVETRPAGGAGTDETVGGNQTATTAGENAEGDDAASTAALASL